MRKNPTSHSGIFNPRVLVAFVLCSCGVFLGMFTLAATPLSKPSRNPVETQLPSGAQSDWSIVPSPNTYTTQSNLLTDVTCVSAAADCWAVGYYHKDSRLYQTLIERWNGTSWTIVPSPNIAPLENNFLAAVTCTSASDCWAVGNHDGGSTSHTLIERWDGTSWSIVASPNTSATQSNVLSGVTCTSTSDCWAVGDYSNGTANQTLIERWDGTSWTIVNSPNASTTQSNILSSVTCSSTSNCWAVGTDYTSLGGVASFWQTLIERWDGISWTIITSANTLPAQDNFLTSVTCVSASDCWAIGYYNNSNPIQSGVYQTLTERWDGSSWTIVTSPNANTTQNNLLTGVTCVSSSECWADGNYSTGSVSQTLIERWDGTSWTVVTSPNTGTTQSNLLSGMTCVSASSECWAAGYYSVDGVSQTLIERWDGTSWTIVTSANLLSTQNNILRGVTCASASDCWAVGQHEPSIPFDPVFETLIERWDGASWAVVPSPNTSATQQNYLNSVTCVSSSDCWAVGDYSSNGLYQTLIERWDGNSWAIVTSLNSSTVQQNFLNSVTCVSSSDCWAVGLYYASGISHTLIERWDGNSWTIVTSPNTSTAQSNFLRGVTCASVSNCWAVGYYIAGSVNQTLIERWDGTSWTIVNSPSTSLTQTNYLLGVTCVSTSDCSAVGYYNSGGSVYQTLIERWDGTSWTIVNSPNTSPTQTNYLFGVTCASASHCWAVGYYDSGGNVYQTLIERWDGNSWTIVTSPDTSATQNNYLFGATCASASDCWAVGYYTGAPETLIEPYTAGTPPIPTSVVSRKTHGIAGDFDIDLLPPAAGIECRAGQPTAGDHRIVFTFAVPVTFATADCGGTTATTSTSGNSVTVNCTGVPNAQTISITLYGVTAPGYSTGDVLARMGVLLGDVNSSGRTDSGDVTAVRNRTVSIPDQQTFQFDVNTSGRIDSGDVTVTRNASVTVLP